LAFQADGSLTASGRTLFYELCGSKLKQTYTRDMCITILAPIEHQVYVSAATQYSRFRVVTKQALLGQTAVIATPPYLWVVTGLFSLYPRDSQAELSKKADFIMWIFNGMQSHIDFFSSVIIPGSEIELEDPARTLACVIQRLSETYLNQFSHSEALRIFSLTKHVRQINLWQVYEDDRVICISLINERKVFEAYFKSGGRYWANPTPGEVLASTKVWDPGIHV